MIIEFIRLTEFFILLTNFSSMYFYRFSIDKDLNLYKKITLMALGMPDTDQFKGACHADEIYYLFR